MKLDHKVCSASVEKPFAKENQGVTSLGLKFDENQSNIKTSATSMTNENSLKTSSRECSAQEPEKPISKLRKDTINANAEEGFFVKQDSIKLTNQVSSNLVPSYRKISGIKQRAVFKPRQFPMQTSTNVEESFNRNQEELWENQLKF